MRPGPNASLNVEPLEVREVPAIVLQGTLLNPGTPQTAITPNGGAVTIQELAVKSSADGSPLNNQSTVVGVPIISGNKSNFIATNRTGTENDTITLSNTGDTLSINASDGIFVRVVFNSQTAFQFVGNTLDIKGVTGLTVDLQLGGNDTVTDNTSFGSTINGGAGNDSITGGAINPALVPLLSNAAFLPLLAGMGGQKTLDGGAGDDTITGPMFGFLNTLKGGAGNDIVIGGLGLDIIDGGPGFDILFGQGGGDIYIAADGGPDFVLNIKGDVVVADPLDLKNPG